ncbi:MAG: adenylate kinase, partial [Oscillospiraceae bacterium]
LVRKLNDIMVNDTWIIDGNYISTLELRIKEADTIFYLDYPTEVCIEGIKARVGKKRDDIPWVEDVLDSDFLKFVEAFRTETKPHIESLLEKYNYKRLYRFSFRYDMNEFLNSLSEL